MSGLEFALILAVLIGVSLGALGSGGSIVTVPVLVYGAGIQPKAAVGMSLAIVGATSLAASFFHYRRGNFHNKAAIIFCGAGIVGAYFGSMLTHRISARARMLAFAALMLVVGSLMLRPRKILRGRRPFHIGRGLIVGLLVGVLTGFLGVGGGFLIVPALVFTSGLDTKEAIGTSLAIIAFNSASGLIGQLRYVPVDWATTLEFLASALVGMGAGVAVANRLPEPALRRAFACALLAIGAVIGWKSF